MYLTLRSFSFQMGHLKEDIRVRTVNRVNIRGKVREIKAIILDKTVENFS